MNERRQKLEAVFHAAMDLDSPVEREHYLAEACTGDPELRREVDDLLKSAGVADAVFQAGQEACRGDNPVPAAILTEKPGDMIGRYKLLEKIGEGGMGVVYMAEQREPVIRRVALKIIKLGMDTRQVVARFEAERQALAMMDHPQIAKVLDAGATGSGRPYFVMELVHGVPITEFCDANQLSIPDRIKLFIPVCQAVQSAHQKGIIHRDLKPSNVLVTLNAGVPHPMVIDFGVAKATNQKLTEKTLFTNFATMIGTPAYMSPEQAEMSKLDVDTRSDIYSLGVLLYELLTGTTPFSEQRLRSAAYSEMQRIIVEEEPERPSTRHRKTRTSIAPARRAAKSAIPNPKSEIDPDLDWIVMKCLEKDRNRRYETANGLAADIVRFINHEPVMARPPSAAYRFQKFVRRNKLQVAAVTALLLTLVLGICISSWQAARAERERERAETRLEAMLDLTKEAFQRVLPALGNIQGAFTPREDLAKATERIIKELERDPNPSPEVRQLLASCYLELSFVQAWLGHSGSTTGQFEEGLQSARQAIQYLQSASTGPKKDEVVLSLARAEMAASFAASGLLRFDEALKPVSRMDGWGTLLSQSTNQWFAHYGRRLRTWARQLTALTLIRSGNSQDALNKHLGEPLEEFRRRTADRERASFDDLWDLDGELELIGTAHLELGHRREAAGYLRERLEVAELAHRRWPYNAGWGGNLAEARATMGEVLVALGQPDSGLPLLQAASQLAESMRQVDPENPGHAMLKVRILRSYASGYVGWAQSVTDSAVGRGQRLD